MKSIDARTANEREIIALAEEHVPVIVTPPIDIEENNGLAVKSHNLEEVETPMTVAVTE